MKKKRYYVFVPPTLHGSSQPSSGFEPDPDPDKHPPPSSLSPTPTPSPNPSTFLAALFLFILEHLSTFLLGIQLLQFEPL